MNNEETLEKAKEEYQYTIDRINFIKSLETNGKLVGRSLINSSRSIWGEHEYLFFHYFFVEKQIKKEHLILCSLSDILLVENYNSRIPDYGIRHICMPILSDNEDLIKRYAQLRYEKHPVYAPKSMDEMVELGDTAITFKTIQHFMINNLEGVEHNLRLYEKYKSKILRNSPTLEIDYRFFYALLAKDKIKIEESIYDLLVPKVHKRRNDSPVLAEIVSLPALAYAKLAWRYGIEIEIDSPLIPNDLLPIQPLDHYEIPYEFLK